MKRLTRLVLLSLLATQALAGQEPLPMRLPDNVRPLAYDVALTLDPAQPRHSGTVTIEVDVLHPSKTLRLNATGIAVRSALLELGGKTYRASARVLDDDLMDLRFSQPVPAGIGQLKLAFDGHIQDKDVYGLFRQHEAGDWYAFTQFESTGARMAFPSFDEPGWKVPWTLSLTVPDKLMAVANTPAIKESPVKPGWKRVDFQTSKPMPSYLVAFGVGPFDVLDGGKVGNTALRYITPRGRAADARFAAKVTPGIVAKLEAYFGMPYPYEKLDSLVLPLTEGFGAMENAGLITYQSGLLLAKPYEETTSFQRDYVAVAAHELAHQWFGNYVTMAWWDDLWLNEAFASWMGDKITAEVMPQWQWDSSLQYSRAKAMRTDRLASARRVHQPILTNQDMGGAFDSITYDKGQTILAMFETWLGDAQFQAGVGRYMKRHAWSNAKGSDFIQAMAGDQPEVAAAFRSFISQPGIPKVSVSLDCSAAPTLKVSQQRFLPKGSMGTQDALWHIPLNIRTPAGQTRLLLKQGQDSVRLPDSRCPGWVQANAGGTGYYRVAYAPGLLHKLMTQGKPSDNEMLADLDDAQALTESGDLPLADALSLAAYAAKHPRREVVEAAATLLKSAAPLVSPDQQRAYAALWQQAFGERARQLGWLVKAGESDADNLLRASLLTQLADYGQDAPLRQEAGLLTRQWLAGKATLDVSVRGSILKTAALEGDRPLFDALQARVLQAVDRNEREEIYSALGNLREPSLAEAARGLLLNKQHDIREARRMLRTQNDNPELRKGALRFVMQAYKPLTQRLSKDGPGNLPRDFNQFCGQDEARAVETFFGPLATRYNGGPNTLRQSLEAIRLCAVYRDTQQQSLAAYLATFSS
ncbi:M1 family metallopeptidase [Chitinimonas viridis]|uniref:Aminopeptidase n=1 Tax=Chitinimonas viridis TaxID=664880 RepID=A0ABT8BA03_9NEIS|nr:M1 family metallopeptidase [Chitinimonas viridis]MDN3578869.1 M1 family metallopeptidase [Chitinimonas viridis]